MVSETSALRSARAWAQASGLALSWAAVTPAVAAADELPTAETLFERHLEAVGGREAVLGHRSVSTFGSVELVQEGIAASFERHARAPDLYHQIIRIPAAGVFEEGHDGTTFWASDPEEGPRLRPAQAIPELRMENDLYLEATYAKYYPRMTTLRRMRFEGGDAYQVEAVTQEGRKEYLYFDASSGLRVGREAESFAGDEPRQVRAVYSELRRFGDVLSATKIDFGDRVMRIERMVLDPEGSPSMAIPARVQRALAPKSVRGVVLKNGRPVRAARVHLTARHEVRRGRTVSESGASESQTTTALDGTFAFEGVRGESYRLSAVLGLDLGSAYGTLREGGEAEGVVIQLSPGVVLAGEVVGPYGAPVAGAQLVAGIGCKYSGATKTDEQGRFEWMLRTGQVTITAFAPGHVPQKRSFAARRGTRLQTQWMLEAAAVGKGVVVDAEGRPVAGVELQLIGELDSNGLIPFRPRSTAAPSGPNGEFTFDTMPRGTYELVIRNHGPQPTACVTLPSERLKVILAPGARVRGLVLDEEGEPQADAEVRLVPAGPLSGEGPSGELEVRADAGGSFQIDAVPEGSYEAQVSLSSFRSMKRAVRVPKDGELSVELRFDAGLSLSGVVVDTENRPMFGAEVQVISPLDWRPGDAGDHVLRAARTGPSGRFRVEGLQPGRYQILASRVSTTGTLLGSSSTSAQAGASEARVILPARAIVRGRLVDEYGHPATNLQINGETPPADATGAFEVAVEPKEGAVLEIAGAGRAHKTIRLDLRGSSELDLGTLVLARGGAVTPRVLD